MATESSSSSLSDVQSQLEIARNEIKNLRSQIISLKYSYRKDVDDIQRQINDGLEPSRQVKAVNLPETCSCELAGWRSIGVVNTWFPGRRGVPRQAALSPEAQGVLTLSPTVINNPAFSLSGLEEFSHVWILFHFHQTKGSHIKTKVAPPRLGGARVGVFGTRAPHRPCPIGLSLVKLDRIEGNVVYFSGVDMVDGTPVLDIKPYIPQYDDPRCLPSRAESFAVPTDEPEDEETSSPGEAGESVASERHVEGEAGSDSPAAPQVSSSVADLAVDLDAVLDLTENVRVVGGNGSQPRSLREAPDGEEGPVQVAAWITSPPGRLLKVSYGERASAQLAALPEHTALQATVTRLLEQDPRSTYLRRKLGSQFYTFRIDALLVSVKFDDASASVTVTSVQQAV